MKINRIGGLLWCERPNQVFLWCVVGMVSSVVLSVMMPYLIYFSQIQEIDNISLEYKAFSIWGSPLENYALFFWFGCIFATVLRVTAQGSLEHNCNRSLSRYRRFVCNQLVLANARCIEELGLDELFHSLHADFEAMSRGLTAMVAAWLNVATVISIFIVIFLLKSALMYLVAATVAVSLIAHLAVARIYLKFYKVERRLSFKLEQGVSGLLHGAKELRLNLKRRQEYFNENLNGCEFALVQAKKNGNTWLLLSQNIGAMMTFIMLGIIVFYFQFRYIELTQFDILVALLSMIYMSGPLRAILNAHGEIRKASSALKHVNGIKNTILANTAPHQDEFAVSWNTITIRNVDFKYNRSDRQGIEIADLTLMKGRVYFVIGANGSGKTTFSKILGLQYLPETGTISFDGRIVTASNICAAREHISSIYADYHLFDKLYGIEFNDQNVSILNWATNHLKIGELIDLQQRNINGMDLSTGQRKRIALLVALLEDRPLVILDEWAADQDPEHKDLFYNEILRYLREKNKVVVVISHDERYFNFADDLIFVEHGHVTLSDNMVPALELNAIE